MRAGLSAIMLSVVQPVAIFVGLPLWLIYRYKIKTMLDYEEPLEASTNGWLHHLSTTLEFSIPKKNDEQRNRLL